MFLGLTQIYKLISVTRLNDLDIHAIGIFDIKEFRAPAHF